MHTLSIKPMIGFQRNILDKNNISFNTGKCVVSTYRTEKEKKIVDEKLISVEQKFTNGNGS